MIIRQARENGQSRRFAFFGRCLVAALVMVSAAACATVSPAPPPVPATKRFSADMSGHRWYYARFRMAWPVDTEPRLFVDTMLAREVVAPVLASRGGDIALWRFHRRARRDDAGHQFSFIFYAPPEPADAILDALNKSPAAARLKDAGVVAAVSTGGYGGSGGGQPLSTTSDTNWSEAMQRAWPLYIDGVSRLWLALIEEAATAQGMSEAPADMDAWLAQYQAINATITATWQNEGRHALLHHLNAIFGYEPIPVVEQRMLRF
ncbi:MAG: hypothetical protein ABIL58_18080 [Pseudomonadota bacterium]